MEAAPHPMLSLFCVVIPSLPLCPHSCLLPLAPPPPPPAPPPRAGGGPQQVLELPNKAEKVLSFAWEPKGHRFAIVHGDSGRPNVSFYSMKDDKGKLGIKHLGEWASVCREKGCVSGCAESKIVCVGGGGCLLCCSRDWFGVMQCAWVWAAAKACERHRQRQGQAGHQAPG
jgi:hypothetical protein